MNILITGITGLFGSYLAKEFSALGTIHGFRKSDSKLDLLSECDFPIEWHEGELADSSSLDEALISIDLVIHAAGMVSFSPKDEKALYEINTLGTINLVNAMLSSGVKKLVHISSVAAIGRSPEHAVIDEDFKWVESPLNTDYALSKYWAELEVWRGEQEGLELLVLNPSVLLGKINDKRSSTTIYKYVLEENSYFPKGDINYLDVRDAAKIARLLVEKEAWGERFILNKESLPYEELFKAMGKVFGKKYPYKPVKNWMLRIALRFRPLFWILGASKYSLNPQTVKLAQQKIFFNNKKVKTFLQFEFKSLKETLEWAKT
jgi:dihydroflavonol-4-reductase